MAELDLSIFEPEDLLPELTPCVGVSGRLPYLKHPLVFIVPYSEHMNRSANLTLRQKTEEIEKIRSRPSSAGWQKFLWLHEKPYRIQALHSIRNEVSDEDFWTFFGMVWCNVENIWECHDDIGEMLSENRPGRERMMTDREHDLLERLPEEFVVFRGCDHFNELGYSWTLSYVKAAFFRDRLFPRNPRILRAVVSKNQVEAMFLRRGEYEIVVDPSVLNWKRMPNVRRPDVLSRLIELNSSGFALHGGVHGPDHWDKVERNAIRICRGTEEADAWVCRVFAQVHDSQRENEDEDPEHGERAADYCRKLGRKFLAMTREQLDTLCAACEGHEKGNTSEDPTIGACWDADRLDLIRVGIIPEPRFFSTMTGRKLILRV